MDKTKARWTRKYGTSVRKNPQPRRWALRSTAACRDPHRVRQAHGRHRRISALAKNGCRKPARDGGFPRPSACSGCSCHDDDLAGIARRATNRREHRAGARDHGGRDRHDHAGAIRREYRRDPRRRRAPGNRRKRPAQAAIWKLSLSTAATLGPKPHEFKKKSKGMPDAAAHLIKRIVSG